MGDSNHLGEIWRLCCAAVNDNLLAHRLTRETFEHVFQEIKALKDEEQIKTTLRDTAIRLCQNHTEPLTVSTFPPEVDPAIVFSPDLLTQHAAFQKAFSELSIAECSLLRLRFQHDLFPSTLAGFFGATPEYISSRIAQALTALRERLIPSIMKTKQAAALAQA